MYLKKAEPFLTLSGSDLFALIKVILARQKLLTEVPQPKLCFIYFTEKAPERFRTSVGVARHAPRQEVYVGFFKAILWRIFLWEPPTMLGVNDTGMNPFG
jgi:hypothetical protein